MRSECGGSTRLTVSDRSCFPHVTMSPAWMNTGSSPRFSTANLLTLPVS
jgi:hypothetical protein